MRKHTCCSVEGCMGKGQIIKGVQYFPSGYCCMHYNKLRWDGNTQRPNALPIDQASYSLYHRMCYRASDTNNKNYGGRGIKVCERWLGKEGLYNFVEDMGSKPSPQHTLDRVDVDGDYSPENCQWATWHGQARNRRNSTKNVGVWLSQKTSRWYAHIKIKCKKIHLGTFATIDEAKAARYQAEVFYNVYS